MSTQYNNAGRTLVVDEVIEVKGTKKDAVSRFKQELDAQLLKRDTSLIRAQIGVIASDSHITPQEKQILKREYMAIESNYGLIASKAGEYGIDESTDFNALSTAFSSLSSYLQPILADMSEESEIESHQELVTRYEAYYDASSVLEELFFRYTTGMLSGLDWREKFEVRITSSLGLSVPLDNTPTSLSVMLLHNGEDVTDDYVDADFIWSRITEDREGDTQWRIGEDLTGKTISVSLEDLVYGYGSFMCRFKHYYSDTMYYEKTGFVTLSKEVPGPAGEDAISVQIFSTNGNIFRSGQAYTTMSATVWRGDEDITDTLDASLFTWERTSGDSVADESWNTSSKAIGRKSIELTPQDVVGRSVFACHVEI